MVPLKTAPPQHRTGAESPNGTDSTPFVALAQQFMIVGRNVRGLKIVFLLPTSRQMGWTVFLVVTTALALILNIRMTVGRRPVWNVETVVATALGQAFPQSGMMANLLRSLPKFPITLLSPVFSLLFTVRYYRTPALVRVVARAVTSVVVEATRRWATAGFRARCR